MIRPTAVRDADHMRRAGRSQDKCGQSFSSVAVPIDERSVVTTVTEGSLQHIILLLWEEGKGGPARP